MCTHLWRRSIANLLRIAPDFICKAFIIKHMDGLVCVFPTWQKVFRKFKTCFRCLTIVSKPGQSSFKVVNTLQNMRIDFYVFHWSWYSIQFDCTISSLIHIWLEWIQSVDLLTIFSPNFLVVKYAPWNCFCNAQSFEWKKMSLNKCPICTIFDFVYWKTLLKVNARI